MQTIIVTGAHGFLGRHTAKLAAATGLRVVGIGHGTWIDHEWLRWGLTEWHEADITVAGLRRCAADASAIIHFAGGSSVSFSLTNPAADFNRTVQTTANVMEFARIQSTKPQVVYCSSASVYGTANRIPILEESQPLPISPYGTNKYIAEQVVTSYASHYKVAALIVRLFSVYGSGLRKQLLWDASGKITSGNAVFMGSGQEVRDLLHVSDAARLMLLAISYCNPECTVINGGTGNEVTVREVLHELSRNLGHRPQEIEFSGETRSGDPEKLVADIQRALSWGWRPKSTWKDGISEYASWWLEEKRIRKSLAKATVRTADAAAGASNS
jgi:UDP-glucose 4-epimerase